jgi:Ca2+-dependent lipid-binding protein
MICERVFGPAIQCFVEAEMFFRYVSATISPKRAQDRRDREFSAMKRNLVAAAAAGAAFVAGMAIAAATITSVAVSSAAGIYDDGAHTSLQVSVLSS